MERRWDHARYAWKSRMMPPDRHYLVIVGTWCAVLVLAGACTPPDMAIDNKAVAEPQLPAARVNLPPPIKLEGSIPPETHADGKMRVDGLLARREKYLEQKVIVRGYLIDKYACPKDAKRCQRAHGYLADTPAGGDKRLLLTNIEDNGASDALAVGTEYVITGMFSKRSADGFVASGGLLEFEMAEGIELPDPDAKKRRRRR